MKSSQFHAICKVLQLFCRIRGYKHVIKFFPHEVSHIEMCMFALRSQVSPYTRWPIKLGDRSKTMHVYRIKATMLIGKLAT